MGFAYNTCEPCSNGRDLRLLQKLKEDCCHLDMDKCGLEQRTVKVGQFEYDVHFADEAIAAPLAMFNIDLLSLTDGDKAVRFMPDDLGDPEDPHDHIYLNDTSRKYTRAAPAAISLTDGAEEDELDIVTLDKCAPSLKLSKFSSSLLPLDQAVTRSIDACPSDEVKRKMYSCVLLVGGGSKVPGLASYLSKKLMLHAPPRFRSEQMEVICEPKETCASEAAWRGAALLLAFDSSRDFWILPDEWRRRGQRILRERAPFVWSASNIRIPGGSNLRPKQIPNQALQELT